MKNWNILSKMIKNEVRINLWINEKAKKASTAHVVCGNDGFNENQYFKNLIQLTQKISEKFMSCFYYT